MDWRFSTFLVLLLGLLFLFSVAPIDSTMCGGDFVKDVLALRNKDGAANCFDFWLNRYQTLIAALIAGVIAFWAARLLFSQVAAQKVEAIARQIDDMMEIKESATDLFSICSGVLAVHDDARRLNPSFEGKTMAAFVNTSNEAFGRDLGRARDDAIRLQRLASRPRRPLRTAQAARAFASDCHSYIFASQMTFYFGFASVGLPADDAARKVDTEQSELARAKIETVRRAYSALLSLYDEELADLQRLQNRAHAAAR